MGALARIPDRGITRLLESMSWSRDSARTILLLALAASLIGATRITSAHSDTLTLLGQFSITWIDNAPGSGSHAVEYALTDDQGQSHNLCAGYLKVSRLPFTQIWCQKLSAAEFNPLSDSGRA